MNALKAEGTGTMTTGQRQEFRSMLDKVTEKQTRRQATGTAKKYRMDRKGRYSYEADYEPVRKTKSKSPTLAHRLAAPEQLDKINSLVVNNSMNRLQQRLRDEKTDSQKKLLRAAIKDKKKLADAPRRYKWGAG